MIFVAPAELGIAEDAVRQGLEHLKRKTKSAEWRVDHILSYIRNGRADLYVLYLDGDYAGFVILSETMSAFTLQRRLLVWCACMARVTNAKGRTVVHPRHREIRKLGDAGVDSIAAARGIQVQYFVSSRKGWEGAAPSGGWELYEQTYMRKTRRTN